MSSQFCTYLFFLFIPIIIQSAPQNTNDSTEEKEASFLVDNLVEIEDTLSGENQDQYIGSNETIEDKIDQVMAELETQYGVDLQEFLGESAQTEEVIQEFGDIKLNVSESLVNEAGVRVLTVDKQNQDELLELVGGHTELADLTAEGDVMTRTAWDYESSPTVTLKVAHYNETGYEVLTQNIVIHIEDANDEPPVMMRQRLPLQVFIPIATPPRTPVFQFEATDPDSDAKLHYRITRQNPEHIFDIDDATGVLYTHINPPYPNGMEYVVCVVAEDKNSGEGTVQVSEEAQLSIIAGNRPPEFNQKSYQVQITENLTVGETVLVVTARPFSDQPLIYLISEGQDPELPFSMENEDAEGVIRLTKELDIDNQIQQDRYRFMIEVREENHGDDSEVDITGPSIEGFNHLSIAEVSIIIKDFNDNPPELKKNYSVTIMENKHPQYLIEIEAVDRDRIGGGNGAPFYFRMDPEAPDDIRRSFRVEYNGIRGNEEGSATLSSLVMFDREQRDLYEVPILIKDSGDPSLFGKGIVTVYIGNEQDSPMQYFNKPILVYKYQDEIPETGIGNVVALDPDGWTTDGKEFQWREEVKGFRLNQSSGEIIIEEDLPIGQYELHFEIFDHLSDDRTHASVTVTVKDLPTLDDTIVPFKISGISLHDFMKETNDAGEKTESRYRHLIRKVKKNLPLRKQELRVVDIVSVMELSSSPVILQLYLSARKIGKRPRYFKDSKIKRLIRRRTKQIKAEVGVDVIEVGLDPCKTEEVCYTCESLPPEVTSPPHVIDTGDVSFVGVTIDYNGDCSREQPVFHLRLLNQLKKLAIDYINSKAKVTYTTPLVSHFYALAKEYTFGISIEMERESENHTIRSCSMKIDQITKKATDLKCQCADGWEKEACQCLLPHLGCAASPQELDLCSGQGVCECGQCMCLNTSDGPYRGKYCELLPLNEDRCTPASSVPLCSGNGECVPPGSCSCHEQFEGDFCECNNFDCPMHNGQLCGGNENGVCQCGQCKCVEGWVGEACACVAPEAGCTAPGEKDLCSGRGDCECGECICHEAEYGDYLGDYCEKTPPPPRSVYVEFCKETPWSYVCSKVGECVSPGVCDCHDQYSGKYCECDNLSCGKYRGEMCGGEDHGKCLCGKCVCDEGWVGEMCECRTVQVGCMRNDSESICSDRGECVCGQCQCKDTEQLVYQGKLCEEAVIRPGIVNKLCRLNASASVCSDRGECTLEGCQCDVQENQYHKVYGDYCECDNFTCNSYNDLICSGLSHGQCQCNECECNEGYVGPACEISLQDEACFAPNETRTCSGVGKCIFSECICENTVGGAYQGEFCEEKPSHENVCEELEVCLGCQVLHTQECPILCPLLDPTFLLSNETASNKTFSSSKTCDWFTLGNCSYLISYDVQSPEVMSVATDQVCFPEPQPQYMNNSELCEYVQPCLECVMYKIYKYDRQLCDERCKYSFVDELLEETYEEDRDLIEMDYHTCPLIQDQRNCDVIYHVSLLNSSASVLFVRPRCDDKWDEYSVDGCELLWPCVQCVVFKTGPLRGEQCTQKCYDMDIYLPRTLRENKERRRGRTFCKFVDSADNCEAFFSFKPSQLPVVFVQRKKRCRNS